MSGVLLISEPMGGLDIVRDLADEVANSTLVWFDDAALRQVSDGLNEQGWDALVLRTDDEGFSGAAMGHRIQLHGVADVVVLVANTGDEVGNAVSLGAMALKHLPHEVPVLLTGSATAELESAWAPVAEEMEVVQTALAPALELAAMCRGAGKSAEWEG